MKSNIFRESLEDIANAAYHFTRGMTWVYDHKVHMLEELIKRAEAAGLIKEDEEWEEEEEECEV